MCIVVGVVVVVVVVVVFDWLFVLCFQESIDDVYVGGDVIVFVLKVNGFVDKIFVIDNQCVKVGDVFVQFDVCDYDVKFVQVSVEVDSVCFVVIEFEVKQ